MKQVTWSPGALRDLRKQFSYLLRINPTLAADTLITLDARADWLGEQSPLGSPVNGRRRKVLVPGTPYLILYRSSAREVEILRIRHQSENWRPR